MISGLVGLAACLSLGTGLGRAAHGPCDIVLIADDLGWNDRLSWLRILTLNLDHRGRFGVRLEHHYVFPTCSPTVPRS